MAIKYSKGTKNIPAFSILRPSKIYPNWDFCFEKQTIWQPRFSFAKFFTSYQSSRRAKLAAKANK
jgi:hypothetical protein